MFFKATFNPPIDIEEILYNFIEQNRFTGVETIKYMNHDFELVINDEGHLEEITFCNQCVNTFDIESVFIQLLLKVSNDQTNITLYESDGLVSDYSYEELEDFLD